MIVRSSSAPVRSVPRHSAAVENWRRSTAHRSETGATSRRAFVLPVVLVIIGLLALTLAGFMFFVRAELAGARADRDAHQARLAADSGLQEVIVTLRTELANPQAWFDAPDRFRHVLVWSDRFDRQADPVRQAGTREAVLEQAAPAVAWRFSIVARNEDSVQNTMRYGITPEAGKLNLNAASEGEITRLVTDALSELRIENPQELVAALLDWLDEDDDARQGGAELEYYSTLTPAYKPKNGYLTSIDELLLIKGWTAALLYGEDVNRNGLLDANEDDGDLSPPIYDNADGTLQAGIAPYVTIWSREPVPPGQGGGGQPQVPGLPQIPGLPQPPGGQPGMPGESPDTGNIAPEGEAEADEKRDGRSQSAEELERLRELESQLQAGEAEGLQDLDGDGLPDGLADGGGAGAGDPNAASRWGPHVVEAPNGLSFVVGRININTAPARVLRAIEGITPEAAAQIVALRADQPPDALKNTNWLVNSGIVDPAAVAALSKRITTQALQFHVEAVGYGDHVKLGRRVEWIIEVRGPVVQVIQSRDLTSLGFAWPIDDDTVMVVRPGQDTGEAQ